MKTVAAIVVGLETIVVLLVALLSTPDAGAGLANLLAIANLAVGFAAVRWLG